MPNITNIGNTKTEELLRDEEDQIDQERTDEEIEEDNRELGMTPQDILNAVTNPPVKAPTQQELVKAAEKVTRTRKQAPKTIPSSQLIELLKEKIELIQCVEANVIVAKEPAILSKGGRDILIAMNKEIEEAKNKALLAIQAL